LSRRVRRWFLAEAGRGPVNPGGPVGPGGRRSMGAASCPDRRRKGERLLDKLNEVEILLVEDNPYDAELTLRALKNKGLANKLLTFPDGVEALDFLFGTGAYAGRNLAVRPKVVLLDLKLPRISGLEVLQRIKNDERTKTIPVVIMTSSQEESDIVRSYNLGVNSYMVKPVDFDKFFQAVEEMVLYWLSLNKIPS
jgi:two-component system, response regulator